MKRILFPWISFHQVNHGKWGTLTVELIPCNEVLIIKRNGFIWSICSVFSGAEWGNVNRISYHCWGSLEPESSCHDRDWIMELPMEADILTFTGILTPDGASVASCFPFDITISLSWFPLLCLHYNPLYHRGRETSSWFRAVTLATLKYKYILTVTESVSWELRLGATRSRPGRLATWSYVMRPTPRYRWSQTVRTWAVSLNK